MGGYRKAAAERGGRSRATRCGSRRGSSGGAVQQIGAAVQPCSRAARQLRRSSRGVVRRWRGRRQQRRGAALATAETAANGECHRSASSRSPVMAAWGGPTGETAVLLDANNQAGPGPNHLGGLCQLLHRGQHRPGQRRGASTVSRTRPTRSSRRTCAPAGGQRTRAVFWQVCT